MTPSATRPTTANSLPSLSKSPLPYLVVSHPSDISSLLRAIVHPESLSLILSGRAYKTGPRGLAINHMPFPQHRDALPFASPMATVSTQFQSPGESILLNLVEMVSNTHHSTSPGFRPFNINKLRILHWLQLRSRFIELGPNNLSKRCIEIIHSWWTEKRTSFT